MFCRAAEIGLLGSRICSVCPKGAIYIGLNVGEQIIGKENLNVFKCR